MNKLIGTTLLTIVLASPAALADETLLEHVLVACEPDIVEFCADVTPGDGRLLHCMAAYEDKISGKCAVALYEAAVILQGLVETIAYLAESCSADIEANCAETPVGEGRILTCLADSGAELSESCQTAIDETIVVEE